MTNKTYNIYIDNLKIGTTELEKADAPMGVVFGDIKLVAIVSGYDFFKKYCITNGIEINCDHPEERLVDTSNIPNLKVISLTGIEIKGQAISINGMDSDAFEVTIWGIPYPFFEEQFPHHVNEYYAKTRS